MERELVLNNAVDFIRACSGEPFEKIYELWCMEDRSICENKFKQLYDYANKTAEPYYMDWLERAFYWLFGDPGYSNPDEWVYLDPLN